MRVQPPRGEGDAEDDAGDSEDEPDGVPEGPREDVPRGLQRRGTHTPEKMVVDYIGCKRIHAAQ